MNYGLVQKLEVEDLDGNKSEYMCMAGDYMRSQKWCFENLEISDEYSGLTNVLGVYAWAWCALDRLKKLDKYGLKKELTLDTLYDMANTVFIDMNEAKESDIPLASLREKSQK